MNMHHPFWMVHVDFLCLKLQVFYRGHIQSLMSLQNINFSVLHIFFDELDASLIIILSLSLSYNSKGKMYFTYNPIFTAICIQENSDQLMWIDLGLICKDLVYI